MGTHTASGGSPTRETFHNVEVARAVGVGGGGDTSILSSLLSRKGRCIEPTHNKRCTVCRDPPPVDSERDWYLRGDPGRRNGDKKLRKLILESKEWGSRKERSLLVKHLEQEEGPMTAHRNKLIRLLETQDGSKLCKSSLLHLARLWRFKSNVWVKKKNSRERPPCEKSTVSNPRSHKQTAEGFGLAEQSAETRQTFQAPVLTLNEPLSCTSAIPAIDTSVPSMERILTLLSSSLDTSGKLWEQSEKCMSILHAPLAWEQVSSTGSPALADMKEMEQLDQLATDFESTLLGFQAMIGSDSLMDSTMGSVSDSLHELNTLGLQLILLVKQEAITWRLLRSYETTKNITSHILALRLFITKFAEKATHLAEKVKGMVQRETVPNQNDLKQLQLVCRTQICKARENIEDQASTGLGPRSLSASSVPMSPEKKLMRAISNDIILPLYRSISSEVLQFSPVATAPVPLTEEWLDATKVKP
mmetsp:Transcript_14084/g.35598  ORF Transcript_14084/g.35598 Transcript_14084/m.35598 type:complete len:475 (+) Transcript_14084:247-1671(+)